MKNAIKIGSGTLAFLLIMYAVYTFYVRADGAPIASAVTGATERKADRSFGWPSFMSEVNPLDKPAKSSVPDREKEPLALPLSFERTSDIWAYANAALKSNNQQVVFEARTAVRECSGLLSASPMVRNFLSGVTNSQITGTLTPERQAAGDDVFARCSSFFSADPKSIRQLGRSLSERNDELLFSRPSQPPATASTDEISNYLSTLSSSAAITAALPTIMKVAEQTLREDGVTDSQIEKSGGIVAELAACDIGRDCSAKSFSAKTGCLLFGRCDKSLTEGWEEGLQNDEAETIRKAAEKTAAKIKPKNN